MKRSFTLGAAATALVLISAAPFGASASNRCGGALTIDIPTTLARIARQCNVNLAELREANPGVDPGDVQTGARIAIPDEFGQFDGGPSRPDLSFDDNDDDNIDVVDYDWEASRTGVTDDYRRGDDVGNDAISYAEQNRPRSRNIRNVVSGESPLWLQPETFNSRHLTSPVDRLSFQKTAAMRISLAGATPTPMINIPQQSTGPVFNQISAPSDLVIECPVVEKRANGELFRVRKIVSSRDETIVRLDHLDGAAAVDCKLVEAPAAVSLDATADDGVPAARFTATPHTVDQPAKSLIMQRYEASETNADYRLPDYNKVGPISRRSAVVSEPTRMSLSGQVTGAVDGCLVMRSESGETWRLASTPPSGEMIGKTVTVWGVAASGGACGAGPSMIVSHAVYAEPW